MYFAYSKIYILSPQSIVVLFFIFLWNFEQYQNLKMHNELSNGSKQGIEGTKKIQFEKFHILKLISRNKERKELERKNVYGMIACLLMSIDRKTHNNIARTKNKSTDERIFASF